MPTPTNYTYALSAFPAGLNEDRFIKEITASSIVTALGGVSTSGTDVIVAFKDALRGGDEAALTALVAAHSGQPLPSPVSDDGIPLVAFPNRQPDGVVKVAISGRQGKEVNYGSHDFTKPASWYSESTRVSNKTLTQNGPNWESGDADIITIDDGLIFDEDAAIKDQQEANPSDPHGYLITLTVDGAAKVRRPRYKTSGGDYTVNPSTGVFTPVSEDWTGAAVVASYSKASGSGFYLVPMDPGRTLVINKVRVKVSTDIELQSSIIVQIQGPAGIFAPQLVAANVLPADYYIDLVDQTVYKTIDQLFDEVDEVEEFASSGFAGPRGHAHGRRVFTFRYETVRTLYSSLGMRMRISLEGDATATGERATAIFYCTSGTDPGAAAAGAALAAGG